MIRLRIDGQVFDCADGGEADGLLQRAVETAKALNLTCTISASTRRIRAKVSAARREIASARVDAEIRQLFVTADNDELVLFL
jgi:hypothetical protein